MQDEKGMEIMPDSQGNKRTVRMGNRVVDEMMTANAVKSMGGNLDVLLGNHYKITEKHMRESYGTFDMSSNADSAAKFMREDISNDYVVGALKDIVMKKAMFFEMRGEYEALKKLRVENIVNKDQMNKALNTQFSEMKPEVQLDAMNIMASNGALKLDMSGIKLEGGKLNLSEPQMKEASKAYAKVAGAMVENKTQLALEGIHQFNESRGYAKMMGMASGARYEQKTIADEFLVKNRKMLRDMYDGMGGIKQEVFKGKTLTNEALGLREQVDDYVSSLTGILSRSFRKTLGNDDLGEKIALSYAESLHDVVGGMNESMRKDAMKVDYDTVSRTLSYGVDKNTHAKVTEKLAERYGAETISQVSGMLDKLGSKETFLKVSVGPKTSTQDRERLKQAQENFNIDKTRQELDIDDIS